MDNNIFGKNIKVLRMENNITQNKLGKILGYSKQSVCFWELGQREPDLSTLIKIANIFNTTVDELLKENFK